VTAIPTATYAAWLLRDFSVIGSSFILPDLCKQFLASGLEVDEVTAGRVSQVACPVLAQVVAGPLQILGLDLYNRPLANLSWAEAAVARLNFQASQFTSIVSARVCRMTPAFGFGGVGNTWVRDHYNEWLFEREVARLAASEMEVQQQAEVVVDLVMEKNNKWDWSS
jgi:hypothetical protein